MVLKQIRDEARRVMVQREAIHEQVPTAALRFQDAIDALNTIPGSLEKLSEGIPKTEHRGIQLLKSQDRWVYLMTDGTLLEMTLNIDNTINISPVSAEQVAQKYGTGECIDWILQALKKMSQDNEAIIASNRKAMHMEIL